VGGGAVTGPCLGILSEGCIGRSRVVGLFGGSKVAGQSGGSKVAGQFGGSKEAGQFGGFTSYGCVSKEKASVKFKEPKEKQAIAKE
jgi:hypothetical protein